MKKKIVVSILWVLFMAFLSVGGPACNSGLGHAVACHLMNDD